MKLDHTNTSWGEAKFLVRNFGADFDVLIKKNLIWYDMCNMTINHPIFKNTDRILKWQLYQTSTDFFRIKNNKLNRKLYKNKYKTFGSWLYVESK